MTTETEKQTITLPCPECQKPVTRDRCYFHGVEIFAGMQTLCEDCEVVATERDAEARAAQRWEARQIEFEKRVPSEMLCTTKRLLSPQLQEAINGFDARGKRGIGIVGEPGTRKTRAAFLMLQAAAHSGVTWDFILSHQLQKLAERDQFSDDAKTKGMSAMRLNGLRNVRVLLIDDIGKERMTDRAESELFAILDERALYGKPLIWTCNSGKELKRKLSVDRAEPIIRRLMDYSEIVKIEQEGGEEPEKTNE